MEISKGYTNRLQNIRIKKTRVLYLPIVFFSSISHFTLFFSRFYYVGGCALIKTVVLPPGNSNNGKGKGAILV